MLFSLWIACASDPDAETGALDTGVDDTAVPDDTVTMPPAGIAPSAADDSFAVVAGATTALDVLANDVDADGTLDPAGLRVVGAPLHGQVTFGADGLATYVHGGTAPDTADTWSYTVTDDDGLVSAPATVTLAIGGSVVLGGTLWATGEELDHPAAHAMDGDGTTRWTSSWSGRGGHALALDFGDWRRIAEIDVVLGPDDTGGADADFSVQVWDGCWQTVPGGEFHGNTAVRVTLPVDVRARRVRYVCTAIGGTCTVRELTVRGLSDVAPTTPLACDGGTMRPVLDPDYASSVFLPPDYDRDTLYPAVFSYHGIGGTTLEADYASVATYPEGAPRRLVNDPAFAAMVGAIVISPHCRSPGDTTSSCWFDSEAMSRMFLRAIGDWNVDLDRVSITGLSGGGIKGWDLVVMDREQIASFVPIASDTYGPYIGWDAAGLPVPAADGRHFCDLRDMPIDAYHGTADGVVYYGGANATPNLDLYMSTRCSATADWFQFDPADFDGRGHDVWDDVYADDTVWTWMLAQRISARPAP